MNPSVCWSNSVGAVTPDDFRTWQEQSRELESRELVFIVGPQRTGTTWLTLALDRHPNIVSKHEGHAVSELVVQICGQVERFNGLAHPQRSHLAIADSDCIRIARQLVDRQLLNYLALGSGKDVRAIVDKSPNHCRHVGFLASLYPWAKFILCTRDVRDAAVSMWHIRRQRGEFTHPTIEEFADWYAREVYGDGVRAARWSARKLAAGRFMEVRYEDHLADPARELERTLRFVGVDAAPEVVRAIVAASTFEKLSGREPGVEGKGVFRRGVTGDWRNYFSPELGDRLLEASERGTSLRGGASRSADTLMGALSNG